MFAKTKNSIEIFFSGVQAFSILAIVAMWGYDKYVQTEQIVADNTKFTYQLLSEIVSSDYGQVLKVALSSSPGVFIDDNPEMLEDDILEFVKDMGYAEGVWTGYSLSISRKLGKNEHLFAAEVEKSLDYLNLISHCGVFHCDEKIIAENFGDDMAAFYSYYAPYLDLLGEYEYYMQFFCKLKEERPEEYLIPRWELVDKSHFYPWPNHAYKIPVFCTVRNLELHG